MRKLKLIFTAFILSACVGAMPAAAQTETPPKPAAPKSVTIPAVKETKLKNGLTVAVVERPNVPIVTVQLLVKTGADAEGLDNAGLANMTAEMLTKGTKTRTATQIAQQMEFLGATINSGAGWNSSTVSVTVTSDKLDGALAIMSDVVLNPAFKQEELDLAKSQAIDGLTYNLTQPGFLASYAASKYSFGEHPAGGTPASLQALNRDAIAAFHAANYSPANAVLIFTGDVTSKAATAMAEKMFGTWKAGTARTASAATAKAGDAAGKANAVGRLLVIDLPNSGQASVNYGLRLARGRVSKGSVGPAYYPASVLNSLLGGGYSSRLNQEIRIKRGLSYGAGSGFAWRADGSNFSTRTQTKNESAAEVMELVLNELRRLGSEPIADTELDPRKAVLTGTFGRNLETTAGLASAIGELYSFDLPSSELNSYMNSVNAINVEQIRTFSAQNLSGGDVVIVGDYAKFKDDLAKRFPDLKVVVIKADELDLSKDGLKK